MNWLVLQLMHKLYITLASATLRRQWPAALFSEQDESKGIGLCMRQVVVSPALVSVLDALAYCHLAMLCRFQGIERLGGSGFILGPG